MGCFGVLWLLTSVLTSCHSHTLPNQTLYKNTFGHVCLIQPKGNIRQDINDTTWFIKT